MADEQPLLSDFGQRYLQGQTPDTQEPSLGEFGKRYLLDQQAKKPPVGEAIVGKKAKDEYSGLLNLLDSALGGIPSVMQKRKEAGKIRSPGEEKQPTNEELKKEWEANNPGTALITSVLGSLAPIGAAGKAAQAVEAPLLATRLGKAAEKMFETAPAIAKGAGYVARGAVEGAGQGALLSGTSDQSVADNALLGGAIGAGVNPITRMVGNKLFPALTPRQVHRATQAEEVGVPLLPKQVKMLEDLTPQEKLGMKAAGESMGFPTHAWGQKSIAARQQQLYRVLDSAAEKATIPTTDAELNSAFNKIKKEAVEHNAVTVDDNGKFGGGALANVFNKLEKMMASGVITGDEYKAFTQKNSELQSILARTHPNRGFGIELNNMLNEALERAAPESAQEIRTARHQLHNSHLLNGMYNEATGKIDFTKLLPAVEGRGGYGSAEMASKKAAGAGYSGDIGKLALVGQHLSPHSSTVLHDLGEKATLPLQIAAGDAIASAASAGTVTPGLAQTALFGGTLAAGKAGWEKVFNSPWYMNRLMNNAKGRKPFWGINPLTGAAISGQDSLMRSGKREE